MLKTSVFSLTTFVFATALFLPARAVAQQTTSNSSSVLPAGSAASTPARTTTRTSTGRWTDQDYRLGAGDKLRVEVYKQEQMSQSVQIRPDGKITLPFVGDVPAAGKTSLELKDALTAQLKEYVNNPVVTVIVQEAIAAQVTVIGDVRAQGPQVLNGTVSVLQALAKAGGLGEFADKNKIRILRQNGSRTDTIPVDYKGMLKGTVQPIYLQPGDTIVVP
jgi:polysaccharide export outer membrane protein